MPAFRTVRTMQCWGGTGIDTSCAVQNFRKARYHGMYRRFACDEANNAIHRRNEEREIGKKSDEKNPSFHARLV